MRYRVLASYQGAPFEAGIGPANSDVVLFAACPPPEELRFEPATGHWRKQVSRDSVQALYESRPVGMFRGERCIVLDDLTDRLHIVYAGHDAYRAEQLGYWEVDRGVFELITPRHEVTDIVEQRLPVREPAGPEPQSPYAQPAGYETPSGNGSSPATPSAGYPPASAQAGRMSGPDGDVAVPAPGEPPLPLEAQALRAATAAVRRDARDETGLEPATGEPGPDQPGPDQPGYAEPGYAEPGYPAASETYEAQGDYRAMPAPQAVISGPPVAASPARTATLPSWTPLPAPSAPAPAPAPARAAMVAWPTVVAAAAMPASRPAPVLVPGPVATSGPAPITASGPAPITASSPQYPATAPATPSQEPALPVNGVTPGLAVQVHKQDAAPGNPPAGATAPAGESAVPGAAAAPIASPVRSTPAPAAQPPKNTQAPPAARPQPTVASSTQVNGHAPAGQRPATAIRARSNVPTPTTTPAQSFIQSQSQAPIYPRARVVPDPAPTVRAPAPAGPAVPETGTNQVATGSEGDADDLRPRRSTRRRMPTQRIFSELAAQAAIPAAAYAIGEDVDGAMCLIRTEEGYEVFNSAGGARLEVRIFDDEESAYFYLFGILVADSVRTGALVPHD